MNIVMKMVTELLILVKFTLVSMILKMNGELNTVPHLIQSTVLVSLTIQNVQMLGLVPKSLTTLLISL